MKKKIFLTLIMSVALSVLFSQESPGKTVMKPALLVVDVQKQYLPMMSEEDRDLAIQMMNWSIWLFRQNDLPVIRVYHTSEEYGPPPGSAGFQFADSLKVTEDDPMIVKTYGSAFNKTGLDTMLKEKDINTLFLCGLSSVGCVLATYMDAYNYDYKAFMIKDALLSHKAGYTDQIEDIFNALDLDVIQYMIQISRQ